MCQHYLIPNFRVGNMMDEERQNSHDDSDYDESEKLYELYVKEEEDLSKRDLSNVENLDKAILSLSSAGLGLSLVFIKNVVELSKANHVWVLYGSWLMFVLSDYIHPTIIPFRSTRIKQTTRVQ